MQFCEHYIIRQPAIAGGKVIWAKDGTLFYQPTACRELSCDLFGGETGGPERVEPRTLRAFREAFAGFVEKEGDMGKLGDGKAQRLEEQDLACRRGEQIGATYNLVDAHQTIINDHGELIGDDAVRSAHDKVSNLLLNMLALWAGEQVGEGDNALIVDTKAQRGAASAGFIAPALRGGELAAGARIARAF